MRGKMKNNKEEKEITFMLYNYLNLDDLIEDRKLELIDKMNSSYYEWSKAKTTFYSNTLEDIVERLEEDYKLNRLSAWKQIINKFLKGVSYNSMLRRFINNRYFFGNSADEVMRKLKINYDEYYFLDDIIKKSLYRLCKEEKIFT